MYSPICVDAMVVGTAIAKKIQIFVEQTQDMIHILSIFQKNYSSNKGPLCGG